eukprot:TRINITY_DN6461_c0_g1_i1.p1 TRINITY_DN6461_c0_g1~~TRINITY_DN6461_c0_g1_i1.p1  ORF type:complete len:156 (-),score=33.21 TRINITY_DN6461_c0_g1_i1:461-868(-)
MKNRIEIVDKKEMILSPLENAIELLDTRIGNLRTQLQANPPNMNALQSLIQGSVVTMVNEGPLAICQTFLGKKDEDQDVELVELLTSKVQDFVKMCGFAIAMNKSLISEEYLPMQKMFETGYAQLREKIKEFIDS